MSADQSVHVMCQAIQMMRYDTWPNLSPRALFDTSAIKG